MGIGMLRRHYPEENPEKKVPTAVPAVAAPVSVSEVKIKDLPEYLATITDVEQVKSLAAADTRKSAADLYTARIAELGGGA